MQFSHLGTLFAHVCLPHDWLHQRYTDSTQIQYVATRARSDDSNALRHRVLEYVLPEGVTELSPPIPAPLAQHKAVRGYYHLALGGAILPSKYYNDYLADDEGYVHSLYQHPLALTLPHFMSRTLKRAREGKLKDKGEDVCAFFYAYGAGKRTFDINAEQPLLGLFRGVTIYRVSNLIYFECQTFTSTS